MDVLLPGSDGIEITEQLKATAALAAIPVVMLTGEARFETIQQRIPSPAATSCMAVDLILTVVVCDATQ